MTSGRSIGHRSIHAESHEIGGSRQSDQLRAAYSAIAARYIELYGDLAAVHPDDLALIDRHLLDPTGPVVDVGCGPGHLTGHLVDRGVDAVGIDLVREFVGHADKAMRPGRFAIGSMDRPPIRDGSVAGLLAWYSLIHLTVDDVSRVLDEFRRLAVDGAPLVLGFFDGDRIERFAHAVTPATRWPVDEMAVRLRDAGFDEIERVGRAASASSRSHAAIVAVAR